MIIILVIVKRKKQHMSMETEHVPHPNPYYKYDINKTDGYIKEELKDSAAGQGFGYINHEPIYEPIDEEPSPYCIPSTYDVPRKSSERPALPQRNSTGSGLVQYENVEQASTLKRSSTPHTSSSQYQNMAGSFVSPHTSISQYENVPLTPDGSKDKTDSAADLTDDDLQDVQPKNKDDAENSSEFSADEMADGYMPMRSINHEVDKTTEGYVSKRNIDHEHERDGVYSQIIDD